MILITFAYQCANKPAPAVMNSVMTTTVPDLSTEGWKSESTTAVYSVLSSRFLLSLSRLLDLTRT